MFFVRVCGALRGAASDVLGAATFIGGYVSAFFWMIRKQRLLTGILKATRSVLGLWLCVVSGYAREAKEWQSAIEELEHHPKLFVGEVGAGTVTVVELAGLTNRSVDRSISDEARRRHLASGARFIRLDYGGQSAAQFPEICQDIAKLRSELLQGAGIAPWVADANRVFIVPEGFGLMIDVEYFADEQRPLALDLAYPLSGNAEASAPCLLEFSCDNVDRMGNYSLVACRDTLLEGFATLGYAIAMADHPVAPPYKGIDLFPESELRVRQAPVVVRRLANSLGLSGKIGVVGFSRGSGMALLLAGESRAEDWGADAAVILSGRFSYLELLEGDHMLARYEKAWGARQDFSERWREHGALDRIGAPAIPLFLSINSGEDEHAQFQMRRLRERLSEAGHTFAFVPDEDGRGHKVPISPEVLLPMQRYFAERLSSDRDSVDGIREPNRAQ